MTKNEILKKLEAYHGQIATITTERTAKVFKDVTNDVKKRSEFQVRFGVAYANQKVVKEKHESGEVEQKGLPAGWKVISPVAVETNRGTVLLRCAPSRNSHSVKRAQWFLDGKEIQKERLESMLLASEKQESDSTPDWMYIKPENLIALNGDPISIED